MMRTVTLSQFTSRGGFLICLNTLLLSHLENKQTDFEVENIAEIQIDFEEVSNSFRFRDRLVNQESRLLSLDHEYRLGDSYFTKKEGLLLVSKAKKSLQSQLFPHLLIIRECLQSYRRYGLYPKHMHGTFWGIPFMHYPARLRELYSIRPRQVLVSVACHASSVSCIEAAVIGQFLLYQQNFLHFS